jgi:hypothetical protein
VNGHGALELFLSSFFLVYVCSGDEHFFKMGRYVVE